MVIQISKTKNFKGDVWFVSDFLFIVAVFFTTMILLFSMSIARLIVGNLIDFTVHVSFLDFSLNTENALAAAMEIKLNPGDPQFKRVLSNAAFQWGGDPRCGSPPCWDGSVYAEGKMHDSYTISLNTFNKFIQGPYIFELRKEFDSAGSPATKRVVMASRDADKVLNDPEVAEAEFYLPYAACAACSKTAVYRLYSTVK